MYTRKATCIPKGLQGHTNVQILNPIRNGEAVLHCILLIQLIELCLSFEKLKL